MNSFDFLNTPSLFIDIGQTSWQALNGDDFVEFPLERKENGRLTGPCRERIVAGMKALLGKQGWRPQRRAFVAVPARGVSLRRLSLPIAPKEEFQRLLRLQIENEFPLSPDELAWGWQLLGQKEDRQNVLVAAVKKDIINDYAQILGACVPVFTVAALARNSVYPPPLPSCGILYIGATESELLMYDEGAPNSIRSFPSLTVLSKPTAAPIYLTGPGAHRQSGYPVLEAAEGKERSATLGGLKKLAARENGIAPLILQSGETRNSAGTGTAWKWAAAAVVLLAALLCLPWVEAIALKPHLAKKLAAIEADRARLPAIDRELDFLQYLKRNQPPYLDTMYLIAKMAPSGTSFESVAMSRKGELSLRGKLGNAQQVTEFRSNMIQSAWFSSVVVEEQAPTPDRRVSVRMTAQVKPIDARKPLVVDVPAAKPAQATNSVTPLKPAKT
jgi:hypothetical protein